MLSTPNVKAELFLASSLSDGLEDNNIQQVTTLLSNKEADPNVLIPAQGVTPFHLVIGNDSEAFAEEVTKLFLRHGGNPNVRSVDGMTPVHVAAAWGRVNILELLLANGGDPLYIDNDGCSPFHYAFDGAYYDAIVILGKYCEETLDKHDKPKYERVLDKILINTGELIAEYIVSESPSGTDIQSSSACNTNYSLLSILKRSPTKATFTSYEQNHYGNKNIKSFSSTTTESSYSVDKFVTRKYHLCFPREGKRQERFKTNVKTNFNFKERSIEEEKLLISQIINYVSSSFPSESMSDESFFVQTKKETEQMPRISSPKIDHDKIYSNLNLKENLKNCRSSELTTSYDTAKTSITPQIIKKQPVPFKYKNKMPLEICAKKEPVSQKKKIPLSIPRTFKLKTIPVIKKDTKSPYKYSSELTYSPNCSIISHSPNLIITSNTNGKEQLMKTPSLQKKTSSKIPRKIIPSKVKALTVCKSKINNSPSCKKYSSNRYCTSSLTKQRYRSSSSNRISNKNELDLILLSPETEINNKPINRKLLSKDVVMRLDEHRYNEESKKKFDNLSNRKFGAFNRNAVQISGINTLLSTKSSLLSKIESKVDDCHVTRSLIKTEPKLEKTDVKHSCVSNFLSEHSKQLRKGMLESKSPCDINSKMFNGRSENVHMNLKKSGIPLTQSGLKELDDSFASTDDNTLPDFSTNSDVSENKSSNNILKNELPDHIKAVDTTDNNFLKKFELSPLWNHDNLSRSSKGIFSKIINSNTSLVSVEEEYKYKDIEKGVILLERRLRTTLARIPTAAGILEPRSLEDNSNFQSSSTSCLSDLPQEMLLIDNHTLRQKLFKLGDEPGPITKSTYRVYLRRLLNLQRTESTTNDLTLRSNKHFQNYNQHQNYANKFETSLWSTDWITCLNTYRILEQQMFQEFIRPDPTRKWREGTTKTSFNYILLDSRITRDLPHRSVNLSLSDKWKTFLSAIFYIGKGKHYRPFSHLYDAFSVWITNNRSECENRKLRRIMNIWDDGYGVVSLHVFQNTIPVEAYTREAAMIEALGTENLENCNSGNYYGIATTWGVHEKRKLGKYLLYKAMGIFMYEGERQLFPEHL